MATVVDKANAYFSSISSLAARVFADVDLVKQACVASGEWEELSVEDQELLTDQVLIDSQVLDRYSSSTVDCDNYEDCFPVLKVNSGEKIIVDFDQDDSLESSTWADEHSAPFSWKTRSQEDLRLDDLDDLCGTRDDRAKKSRFTRLRSPDRSVWDISSFLSGCDRKNEIEKMFEKFKIKMPTDDDENVDSIEHPPKDGKSAITAADSDFSPTHDEHSRLIRGVNKSYTYSANDVETPAAVMETKFDGEMKGSKKKHKHKKDKHSKEKKTKSKSRHMAEPDSALVISTERQSVQQSTVPLSDDLVLSTATRPTSGDDFGSSFSHSVALHMAESVELPSTHVSCQRGNMSLDIPRESNVDDDGSVNLNPLDISTAELLPETSSIELDNKSKSGTIKSGFEFLDEW